MPDTLQRTLVLLKPDALHRGIVGEVMHRFERVGAKMVGLKMLVSDKDTATKHYTEDLAKRRGEAVRSMMIEMITSGPIIAIAYEGVEIIDIVRKLVGATEPKASAPGTIRGDFSHVSFGYADAKKMPVMNLIHASSSPEDAEAEIAVWFKPEELVHHKPGYTRYTLGEN
ncbi:MAG TPA: nucleoside-diphosphate kinase [Negativicutes bacterium]|nr:nucleoside-diphosphate kinase [Negativicutes bacterium]